MYIYIYIYIYVYIYIERERERERERYLFFTSENLRATLDFRPPVRGLFSREGGQDL